MLPVLSPTVSLGDLATAISVLVVGVLGVITIIHAERQKRKENTIHVLLNHFDSAEDKAFDALLHSPEPCPDGSKVDFAIRNKLNQFEFLCVAMKQKVLDEELILQDASYRIYRVYTRFQPYIEGRRKATGFNSLFENIEWAVKNKIHPRYRWKETPPT